MLLSEILTLRNLLLCSWLAGTASFVLMGIDKMQARFGSDRISERTLHTLSLLGGFWGTIGGAIVFHHKVSKPSFWPSVILAILLWVLLLYFVVFERLPAINL